MSDNSPSPNVYIDPKYDPKNIVPPKTVTIGRISSLSGILSLADSRTYTKEWKTASNCGGQWAIDMRGASARYLAERMTAYRDTIEELCDGTIRVHVPTNEVAVMLSEEAKKFAERESWKDIAIERHPKQATEFRLKDAARERHVGAVEIGKFMTMVGIAVPEKASATVVAILDANNHAREIRILLD